MATKKAWATFPYDSKNFNYTGTKLEKAWAKLHAGDQEPYPNTDTIAATIKNNKALAHLDAEATAAALQDAWRAFHVGEFQTACETGEALGPIGSSVACKAGGVHATYLVDDSPLQLQRYEALLDLAGTAAAMLPKLANSHYRLAFVLGRYSQRISITKALTQGLAGKVKASLDAALELAPKHAEAHTALGLYHAEIIDKVGSLIGGITYGAKAVLGEKHLQIALELTPDSPIAWIEYGNGLMLLYGDEREDDAAAAYEKATQLKPKDAMEKLDIEYAKSQLED